MVQFLIFGTQNSLFTYLILHNPLFYGQKNDGTFNCSVFSGIFDTYTLNFNIFHALSYSNPLFITATTSSSFVKVILHFFNSLIKFSIFFLLFALVPASIA